MLIFGFYLFFRVVVLGILWSLYWFLRIGNLGRILGWCRFRRK